MKKKIFKYYLILIFLVLLATIFFTSQIAQKYYKAEVENKLKGIGFSLEYYLQETNTRSDINYDSIAHDFASKYNNDPQLAEKGLRITFVDFAGQVLGDSEVNYQDMENHLNRKEIQEAIQGKVGSDIRFSKTVNSDLLYVAMSLAEPQVLVRVSVPLIQLQKIDELIRFFSLITFLVALLLVVIVSFRIAGSIIKPLNDLILASQEIAKGNYQKRITIQTKDELGQLAWNFNEMAAKLDVTIEDLQRKKVEVESIVDSLSVGLVAVDKDSRIILLNPVASNLFAVMDASSVTGARLVEYIRNNRINTLLKETIDTNKPLAADVVVNERILQINTSPIKAKDSNTGNSGGIVFMQDITKIRKLEQLRTEFVSNVTHELRTPITSIKGFIETLKNGALADEKVATKFLDIIDIEAERLHDLINDILQLSEIETIQKDTNIEILSVRAVIEEVFALVQNTANEKGINLQNQVNAEILIKANKNRMKQLFLNLVDNGIKYNVSPGLVTITAFRDSGKIVVSVKDTGIGIPAEHRARIFERFYRVDKGRSRDMGGTGLGLSIVKHIVNLYNGDIKVRAEENKGTEFIIQIPS